MKLADMPLGEYISLLASDAPAPGGGSAAALCGAQGAALNCMVAALTLKRKKYEPQHALCHAALAACDGLCQQLTAQIDADTQAYQAVAAAYKLPKEPQGAERDAQIAHALTRAALVPLDTMRLALEAMAWTARLCGQSNPNVKSDLAVAAHNLTACARGAWENVRVNLNALPETPQTAQISADGTGILASMDALNQQIEQVLNG